MALNIDIPTEQQIEIEEHELDAELNDTPQAFDTDLLDNETNDLFDSDERTERSEVALDINAVNTVINSATSMIAGILSSITDKPAQRYMPTKESRLGLSKAILKAFPSVKMSPFMAVLIAFIMCYAPVTVFVIQDIKENKEKKAAPETNEKSTIDNSSGN